ncbi:MAG: DUF4982 domain-containing protein [Prevotella sp.]|nr:DUF4982 domain-containing protein [Prevotella sp.]
MKKLLLSFALMLVAFTATATERVKLNFNADWLLTVGDVAEARNPGFDDSSWQPVTLPYAFNGGEAFKKDIVDLTDTITWYRKHFTVDAVEGRKFFAEFEGVRQGADFYLNGQELGFSENGVMACGLDLTPFIKDGENVLAVRCDNSWQYRSRTHNSRYQWNDKNFNANYGGIPKNVFLHITDKLYQTLPLYSNLGTTGTYIYATDFDIPARKAVIHAESQVRNDDSKERSFTFFAKVIDLDGKEVAHLDGQRVTMKPGETRTVSVAGEVSGLHFWSWGYGYLYTVKTLLKADDGSKIDDVITRTGFRKTEFKEGKTYLNDRVLMMHGYAQRTSNEWPGTGLSVPAWLSDYSNDLIVKSGGNLVRWMHVCPWKQDIESCDRVGLIQAMPAGDAEKDVDGPRWNQRTELMRDAIIYNRNNPSILFYECGNFRISKEHIEQMKKIRDEYDPNGGRAIGSREMLDRPEAEYGGEMLYINKSATKPMWAMEYYRDEGLRKYWDEYSYPFHKEGDGPLYRGAPAKDYNHNMDALACGMVERWHEYWLERPGTGKRVSNGGVKIVFSDTNTHHRGESNYRTSGVVDAMRIPKDAFYAHQVMWDGWVSPENDRTYIVGHWNYKPGTTKPVYVVSTGDEVELFVNGKSVGKGERTFQWLFTFNDVAFEAGKLEAVSYRGGQEVSRYEIVTAGEPFQLKLTTIENPEGFKADGADMALVQVEVLDREGRRCPLDDRLIHFEINGEVQWIGGIATRNNKEYLKDNEKKDPSLLDSANKKNLSDNYVGRYDLPVECGVNRVLIKSTVNAGDISLSAYAEGVRPAYTSLKTQPVDVATYLPQRTLKPRLDRGETPATPSYTDSSVSVDIVNVAAGSNAADMKNTIDDNELTEWKSDGQKENAWVKYTLARKAAVSEVVLKLTGWRQKSYPLEVYAGKKKVWEGVTPASLGYVHLTIDKPVAAKDLTIRMVAPVQDSNKFGLVKELAGGVANEMDRIKTAKGKVELRIVEADLLEAAK